MYQYLDVSVKNGIGTVILNAPKNEPALIHHCAGSSSSKSPLYFS